MIKNSSNFGPNHRKLRVGELIKQNLGQIFLKNEAKIPSFIYSYVQQVDDKKLKIDRKYNNNKVIFYYLDDAAPYFIYGSYKNEIIERIKCFMNQ